MRTRPGIDWPLHPVSRVSPISFLLFLFSIGRFIQELRGSCLIECNELLEASKSRDYRRLPRHDKRTRSAAKSSNYQLSDRLSASERNSR